MIAESFDYIMSGKDLPTVRPSHRCWISSPIGQTEEGADDLTPPNRLVQARHEYANDLGCVPVAWWNPKFVDSIVPDRRCVVSRILPSGWRRQESKGGQSAAIENRFTPRDPRRHAGRFGMGCDSIDRRVLSLEKMAGVCAGAGLYAGVYWRLEVASSVSPSSWRA